jgi:hypothetical protein
LFLLCSWIQVMAHLKAGRKEAAVARRDDYLMLMHIIAILFAMASLAERLIADPPFVRRLVLPILRQAEAIARAWIAREAGGRSLRHLASPTLFDTDGPQDALRLALCFRALALVLGTCLARFAAFGIAAAKAHAPWRLRARLALCPLTFASATLLDTS